MNAPPPGEAFISLVGENPQTVSKDNSLGSPQPPTFMLTQKISGIAGGATPSRAKK